MSVELKRPSRTATPIHLIDRASFERLQRRVPAATRRWWLQSGFSGAADTHCLVPGNDGRIAAVWAGVRAVDHLYALAALPRALPEGPYRLGLDGLTPQDQAAALSWQLGSYSFDRYRKPRRGAATLMLAPSATASKGLLLARTVCDVRDWITTPAEHMGPQELSEVVRALARQHGARYSQVVGDALLRKGFPAVHAVGRAAARAPRLIELNWGNPRHPRLALVGKGVCFDSGGLDIKPADGMRWMKKDMGGAANAIGLAALVMALELPVRLQLLVPAVENAIAGNAFRPGDVIRTRKGLHIEIGNTDAEGRVILCDALAYAMESKPNLLVDMATLTGAARVALGPQLPALFCRQMPLARELVDLSLAQEDPMWHLPLWAPYHLSIDSDIADIVNTGRNGMAGAITAALFLADFVPESTDWLHLDLFAWNDLNRPGRPVGGEAQTLRTLLAYLERRYPRA